MTTATAIAVVAFNFFGEVSGLYRAWRSERLSTELWQLCVTWAFVSALLFVLGAMTKTTANFSRVVTFGWLAGSFFLASCMRIFIRLALREVRSRGRNTRRVAIFGATAAASELYKAIQERPWLGMQLVGIYATLTSGADSENGTYRGGLEDLVQAAKDGSVDIVYVALPLREEKQISETLRNLADTTATVHLVTDFFTYDLLHARWSMLGRLPVVSVYDSPFRGPAGLAKRTEDILVGSLILVIIALPLVVIALLVKVSSPGPVFFRQRRYGLNGREIRVLKFRTMSVCEDGPSIKQATKNDPRFTALGRILRRTSLDELPQFLQVLAGHMSIVGPRPHAVAHNEEYRVLIHGYMLRHKVKPGITGWAQVNGLRGETDDLSKMERRVQHDLDYIQNWNLLLDLKIIVLTIFGAKKSRNAV